MNELVYTTTAGIKVRYEPISTVMLDYMEEGVRNQYRKQGRQVDMPTYEVQTAGGGSQRFDFDDKYVEENPDQKPVWDAYQETQRELTVVIGAQRSKEIMLAVQVDMPKDDRWIRKQRRKGVDNFPALPVREAFETDEAFEDALDGYQEELYVHYLQTEILKTVEDVYGVVDAVMHVSLEGAVSKEMLDAMSANFRNTLPEVQKQLDTALGPDGQGGKVDS